MARTDAGRFDLDAERIGVEIPEERVGAAGGEAVDLPVEGLEVGPGPGEAGGWFREVDGHAGFFRADLRHGLSHVDDFDGVVEVGGSVDTVHGFSQGGGGAEVDELHVRWVLATRDGLGEELAGVVVAFVDGGWGEIEVDIVRAAD